jgi:hypothetical protein
MVRISISCFRVCPTLCCTIKIHRGGERARQRDCCAGLNPRILPASISQCAIDLLLMVGHRIMGWRVVVNVAFL